jgi:hypothetical protein
MNERVVDLLLAAVLAALPLLPTGPQYFGWSSSSSVEVALLALTVLLCMTRRGGAVRARTGMMPVVRAGWVVTPFIVAATGSALIGLASSNAIPSSVFLAHLREAPLRLLGPMNQGGDPMYALRVWLTLVEGPAAFLLVVAICRRASDPGRRARAALVGAAIGLAMVSGFAVFQYVARFRLHPHWAQADPGLVRSHATFEDPNTLGSYLVLGLGLAIGWLLRERIAGSRAWRAWLAAGVVALAAAALVTTVSRAALGAAALALPLLSPRRTVWRTLAIAAVLVTAWLAARVFLPGRAAYDPTSPVEAVLQTLDPRVPLAQVLKGRQLLWTAALDMARGHPITGVGLGQYPRLLGEMRGFPRVENAHNLFLQVLAEMGGVGLLAFLLVVIASVWTLRLASRAGGPDGGLARGLAVGFLAFSLTLLVGDPLLLPSVQLAAGTSLAAGLTATFRSSLDTSGLQPSRLAVAAATAALTAAYGTGAAGTTWRPSGDLYGYSWGLYGLERDQTQWAYRWIGREARLYLPLPDNAAELRLQFAAFPPPAGGSTTIAIEAAGERFNVARRDGTPEQVRIPLDPATLERRAVAVRLAADRVFVPAEVSGSDDRRELGALLRPPWFVDGDGRPISR